MTKDEALNDIENLIDRFSDQFSSYKKNDYNETLTRRDFIDPFFRALGWDIDNRNGYAEAYREVIHEDRIKIGTATKAPDYSFRLPGGKRLFFVEAKKPSVLVRDETQPAYQVRRYGWSAKMPISIITDFEEFAIYDCSKKPNPNDKASVARIKYLTYKDYTSNFDFIWNTFSKERVLKGSFDQFIGSDTNKKGTSTVDKEFLQSLDDWRTRIAIDICKNNRNLTEEEINFIVQQTIDRIIFLRIAEDRSVEPYGNLKLSIKSGEYYNNLFRLFQVADDKYNSGIFDLSKDQLSKSIKIDNKVIKSVINQLYYPECPYEFSVLPVEILGSAYEQFLGKQIKVDANRKVKIEEKPEVRKAGGVYYTPQYIVDYIVQRTIGRLIEGKKPAEVSKIKIVDPACGSGSFLIGAYQYLLDWHKNFYNSNGKTLKGKKNSSLTLDGNLTTSEKKRILINNIYGVDLDVNAVEVTKLSLLLKCMEGETEASIATQLSLFNDRVLPTLDSNITSGNSLIDTDFYDLDLDLGFEKQIKPFNWKRVFPAVFANGGFDAVIGNPPYGAELSKEVQKYCLDKFPIGNTDTAALFMIQAKHLLKSKGFTGYIIPKSFTFASNWLKTRNELLDDISLIVDCSKVWKEVKLEMSIYISQKDTKQKDFVSAIRAGQKIIEIGSIDKKLCSQFNFIVNGVSDSEIEIGNKMFHSPERLNSFLSNRRGGMLQKHLSEEGELKVIGGKQVQRYFISDKVENRIKKSKLIEANSYIEENSILVQNIVSHIQNPLPRIQITATTVDAEISQCHVILDTVNQLVNKSSLSNKYLLGVLNSKPISWYTYRFVFANAIRTMHFDSSTTEKIPFPNVDLNNKTQKCKHDEIVNCVDQILQLKQKLKTCTVPSTVNLLIGKVEHLENKINLVVAELFGLSKEEFEIIE
ncbi:methyltransferase [Adhaeribacter arboris]|uniref:site-specific DNA-methyltransferase (adenine-specific) n=1 Tax=Adhaeribacter arboris TaxID=2072846 RepID=A0A2T2YMB0_9BACT|nr:N-6 DNA methylase [Adhaeribacter arboris]PSR56644.1 methyltransferase [Adhaeribacter arboris]